eukprot:9474803-Lingulodinium_polyedra.AAC.1
MLPRAMVCRATIARSQVETLAQFCQQVQGIGLYSGGRQLCLIEPRGCGERIPNASGTSGMF